MDPDPTRTDAPRPAGVRTTKRRGRTSPGQTADLEALGPRFQVRADAIASSEARQGTFGRRAPLLVDIGVGDGRATVHAALAAPDTDVLAIELHRPGIVKLLRALDAEDLSNVRLIDGDAELVLAAIDDGSVAAIRVLFPDPWPKRRHVTRRLVDRPFVQRAGDLLVSGGELHVATDAADYADHIRSMVATDPRFALQLPPHRPPRPVTAYEQRGIDAGRAITDLVYRRR